MIQTQGQDQPYSEHIPAASSYSQGPPFNCTAIWDTNQYLLNKNTPFHHQ